MQKHLWGVILAKKNWFYLVYPGTCCTWDAVEMKLDTDISARSKVISAVLLSKVHMNTSLGIFYIVHF